MNPNRFISFEGIDGAGKSTHIDWYAEQLREAGQRVLVTREPGGTVLAEQLRELVLNETMSGMSELLLVFAARADHLTQVIEPALNNGDWIICDRFTDSSFAYQGGGRQVDQTILTSLEQWVAADCSPSRTYLFDLAPEQARRRREAARDADRFEAEQRDFFERVRQAYLARQAAEPDRIVLINASDEIAQIRDSLSRDQQALISARLL